MDTNTPDTHKSWLDRPILSTITLNWETLLFALILILGIITRFYDLGARVISHDENSHVYYSWRLSRGEGYQHTPLTHGPFLFHATALSYFLFGDNDFTSRIPAAALSVAAIAFLWYFRRYLGRTGALITAGLMLISPFMLYYGRYIRNEAFVVFFGVVTIWAILRYLETGEVKFTYWLTAATVLHFTAKETSFIYTAQAMLFLGLYFVYQSTKKPWEHPRYRNLFLGALIFTFVALTAAGAFATFAGGMEAAPPGDGAAETTVTGTSLLTLIPVGLGGIGLLLALYFAIRGLTWDKLKKDRAFGLIILLGTLVLPQLAPIPVRLAGWNPTDYSYDGMIHTAIFLIPLVILSLFIGYLWNPKVWLTNAAIFYIPFTILYTTVFTNGAGFFTGLVGSLGYWLEQQAVERGSQPWYYYTVLQVPFYEFLPALGCLLALFLAPLRGGTLQHASEEQENNEVEGEGHQPPPVLSLLGFWVVTSVIAYSVAGEKMPWLTVHIALPMILVTGWALGTLIDQVDWKKFRSQRGALMIILMVVFIISLTSLMGTFLGPERPFQGKELAQLYVTSTFFAALLVAVASGWGVAILLKEWDLGDVGRVVTVIVFSFLAILTARTAFRAAYINYDYPTEFLVYAHMARGPKEALAQIEELSQRTTDGLDMVVAYDDETTYPYWWYLRNYPNQKYYGANPTRELRDAPVILIGDNNFAKIEPVVGQAYYQFDYIRIWWPNQDYYGLTWERIFNALRDPAMRGALMQIWLNRDYTKYGEITGKDLSLTNWSPADRMRLYVRKDIAAQVWNLGATPVVPEEIVADPYEGKEITILADNILGTNGTERGQFQMPRDLAVAPDGTLYIADTGNHRIQHLTTDGEVLHVWGSFADSAQGEAPPGTFYEPWGIAVGPDGSVYVSDTWNHRIQKFSSDGTFIYQWGYFGQAESGEAFWGPRDLVIDSDGNLYVTDTGNKRVVIFDGNGNYLSEFGTAGLLSGQFDEPVGLAIGEDGDLYVADTWNKRVQVFSAQTDLNFLPSHEWEIVGWYGQSLDNKPYIAVDNSGRVFVSDPEGYRILQFDDQGEFVHYWGDFGEGPDGFNLPTGMAVDPNGGLWVADAGNHRVMHFTLLSE